MCLVALGTGHVATGLHALQPTTPVESRFLQRRNPEAENAVRQHEMCSTSAWLPKELVSLVNHSDATQQNRAGYGAARSGERGMRVAGVVARTEARTCGFVGYGEVRHRKRS